MVTESAAQSLNDDERFLHEVMANAGPGDLQHETPAPYFSGAPEVSSAQVPSTRPETDVVQPVPITACDDEQGNASSQGCDMPLPEVSQACVNFIIDATATEERAMTFDRAGAYPGAVNLYREAAAVLSEALHLMPEGHPDVSVIDVHIREIQTRASYLYSLGVQPAEIPLQEHIHGAELHLGSCAQGGKTTIAAGALVGITGLALVGPITGVALAAGAAYATTRHDGIGNAARTVGDVGLRAVDHTKALNQEHRFDKQLDQKLGITEKASAIDETLHISEIAHRAGETARAIDDKLAISGNAAAAVEKTQSLVRAVDDSCGISRKSQAAAAKTAQVLNEFDEKHQVTDKLNYHVATATSTMSDWLRRKVTGAVLGASTSSGTPEGSRSLSGYSPT